MAEAVILFAGACYVAGAVTGAIAVAIVIERRRRRRRRMPPMEWR